MDGITGTAASPDNVNRILQMATDQNLALDRKLMKATVEVAVGVETGKGGAVDVGA
jgi:hypothetical protein